MNSSRLLRSAATFVVVASSHAVAIAQTLCVSDSGPGQITQVINGSVSPFASGVSSGGLVFDSGGNLYAGDWAAGGLVWKFDAGSGARSLFASGFNIPGGLAFDAGGNLYVANSGTNQVLKVASGSSTPTSFLSGGGLAYPWGLAMDADGNLYVSNYGQAIGGGGHTILKITPGNAVSTLVSDLTSPTGLAFNPVNGLLYAADYGTHEIWKINPVSGASTLVASGISLVQGLACDAAGNVYAASYGANTIYAFDLSDHQSTFATGLQGPIYITVGAIGIPEPSTFATAAGAVSLLGAMIHRRRRHIASGALRQSHRTVSIANEPWHRTVHPIAAHTSCGGHRPEAPQHLD